MILVGDIQLAAYKILNALWVLGTHGTTLINRDWINEELNRHRPLLGECLGSFASCFPIAFLEPEFNGKNKYSIMFGLDPTDLSEHSLEAQNVMMKLGKNLPHLDTLINELKTLSESGNKYNEAPYVIEVILPTVCSYLNYWWSNGSSLKDSAKGELKSQTSIDQDKTPPPQSKNEQKSATPAKLGVEKKEEYDNNNY